MTYAGFVFNILATGAGLFGLFLAIKAYKVGIRAYEVSAESYKVAKEQGKRSFELEMLKELTAALDEGFKDDATLPEPSGYIASRLLFFPPGELELWEIFSEARSLEDFTTQLLEHSSIIHWSEELDLPLPEKLGLVTTVAFHHELLQAIRQRTE